MTPNTFESGRFTGQTEATMQGLAHSLDLIRSDLDRLTAPAGLCAERGRAIERLEERQRSLTWLVRGMWGLVTAAGLALASWWASYVGGVPR